MYLYSIRSIEQTTNSYSGKWGVCYYLVYELDASLHGETTLRFFFVNNPLNTLKACTLNTIVHVHFTRTKPARPGKKAKRPKAAAVVNK
jgi:hypothetical protein